MRWILYTLALLTAAACTPANPYASYAEVEELLAGVDLDELNTRRLVTCIPFGNTSAGGGAVPDDATWIIATKAGRDAMSAQAARLNQTRPEYDWELRCRPTFALFTDKMIRELGGPRAAQTALWYPEVTVVIDGKPVTIKDYDERRRYATCQRYRPDGFQRRSFRNANCT